MAKKKKYWIAGAIKKKGSLRKTLGKKKGEKVTLAEAKAAGKKSGKTGKRGRLATTLIKLSRRKKKSA